MAFSTIAMFSGRRALDRGDAPLYIDMHGAGMVDPEHFVLAPDAKRFENWEFPYALVLGLGEAARYALEAGIEETGARAVALAAEVREKAAALPGVRIADPGARLCAIATLEVAGRDAEDLGRRLRQAGVNVNVSLMGEGPNNAPEAGAPPVLRISPHYYNTSEEIDRAVAVLGDLLGA